MLKKQMEDIYKNIPQDKIPWNLKTPPEILQNLVENNVIKPCSALELGCGAGNYIIYFALKGFNATGVDFSEKAIEIAKVSAENKQVNCKFIAADIIDEIDKVKDTFNFIYDWEVMHHIFPENRQEYINNVPVLTHVFFY